MARQLTHHFRRHLVAYVALFFALSGTAWAVGNAPFVAGGGQISSAALAVPATAGDPSSPDGGVPDQQGPTFLSIPDFGEFYLAGCWDMGGWISSRVGYRNTTDHVVEGEALPYQGAQPGANRVLPSFIAGDQLLGYKTTVNGQTVAHVASVRWSVLGNSASTSCRTYAQVIVQP